MANLDLSRVPSFYHKYISLVEAPELHAALAQHESEVIPLLQNLPADKWDHRYAPDKWSIKEVVQHLIDAERVFAYRALRFSRKDTTPLPGFDENGFAAASKADKRTKAALMDELATVQRSSVQLFSSFDEEQLDQAGTANGNSIYVKAIGFIIAGHVRHHKKILLERYLKD